MAAFGGGYDISLSNKCNENNLSRCYFGQNYELPEMMVVGTEAAKSYLAGQYNFIVKEVEVYQIILKEE